MLSGFYYNALNERQKEAYNQLCSGIASGRERVSVNYTFSGSEAGQLITAVQHENPDYYSCVFQAVAYSAGGGRAQFSFRYLNTDDGAYSRAFDEIYAMISARLSVSPSEYDICLAVHDVLASIIKPDDECNNLLNSGTELGQNDIREMIENGSVAAFTAYGAIVNRRAVCMGIASAAKLFLEAFGVQCALATGKDSNGVGHMWNIVEAEGDRYNLDITTDLMFEGFEFVRYGCCLVPDDIYFRLFTPDYDFGCTSLRNCYFVKKNAYFTNLSGLVNFLEQYNFSGKRETLAFIYRGGVPDKEIEKYVHGILYPRLQKLRAVPLRIDGGIYQCGIDIKK